MGNTYSKIYIHLVFGTKNRDPIIKPEFEKRLKAYITKIAKHHKIKILAINGTQDHLHILLVLPPSIPISRAVQFIKGGSSKWLNEHFFNTSKFRWQKGYGAFSINKSMVPLTLRYIQKQKEHHINRSYQNEFRAILKKHSLA